MRSEVEREVDEVERLRQENAELRRTLSLFKEEHRFFARSVWLVLFGSRLTGSIRRWLSQATPSNPLPAEETADVAAAVIRRLTGVGVLSFFLGFLVPTLLLVWQNMLIRSQNVYFREQTSEIRKQVAMQEEQGDLSRRKELIATIYDGENLSLRTRTEALKALVQLDRKLLKGGVIEGPYINLRGINLSCSQPGLPDCADLSGSRLPRVDFTGAVLKGVDFSRSDLQGSILSSCNLSGAIFTAANLRGTKFRRDLNWAGSAPLADLAEAMKRAGVPREEAVPMAIEVRQLFVSNISSSRMPTSFEQILGEWPASPRLMWALNLLSKAAVVDGSEFGSIIHKNSETRLPLGILPRQPLPGGINAMSP